MKRITDLEREQYAVQFDAGQSGSSSPSLTDRDSHIGVTVVRQEISEVTKWPPSPPPTQFRVSFL